MCADPRQIREKLSKLSPEERTALESRLMDWYADTGTLIRRVETRHGRTYETFAEVISIPTPPGYTGPDLIHLRFDDEPDGGKEASEPYPPARVETAERVAAPPPPPPPVKPAQGPPPPRPMPRSIREEQPEIPFHDPSHPWTDRTI